MAALNFYLTSNVDAQNWCALSESTQTAATTASGWTVSTGSTNHSELESGTERAASTFTGTTVPDGSLDSSLGDAFRSPSALTGSFANADWVFHFVVRAVTNGGAQDGRVRFRLFKADADGSNATEITSGHQQASAVTDVSTSADFDSTLTVNPGAFSITNQYIFIQIAWERTGAGGMTNSDILFRTGSSTSAGTRIVTADFTASTTLTATAPVVTFTAPAVTFIFDQLLVAGAPTITFFAGEAEIPLANLVQFTEQFDVTSEWTAFDSLTVTANTNDKPSGFNVGGSKADTLNDPGSSQSSLFETQRSVGNDDALYICSVFIRKDSTTSRFPELGVNFSGGTGISFAVSLNTSNGSVVASGSGDSTDPISFGSVDHDSNWWRVWWLVRNTGGGNNLIRGFLYPARATTHGGVEDGTATGSIIAWGFNIKRGTTLGTYEPHPSYIAPQAGAPVITITAPTAVLDGGSGTNLSAGAPVITITAPSAARTTTVTQTAGAPTTTITAPATTRVATIALVGGAPTILITAPAANRTTTRTATAGAPTVVFSAPTTAIAFDQFVVAGAPLVTITAPTAVLSSGSGAQTLDANAAVVTFTAPTAVRVTTITLTQASPVVTVTAPAAGIEVTAGDQTLVATAPIITTTAPAAVRIATRSALAGAPIITVTAPTATRISGGTTIVATAPIVVFSAPSAFIPSGGFAWPRTARYRYEYRV